MLRTKVLGIGSYVPDNVVTNDQLRYLNQQREVCDEIQTDTTDEWVQKRTGIRERRFIPVGAAGQTSDLALEASKAAIANAEIEAKDIDCIILATLSPDIQFPGTGIFLQKKLGISGAGVNPPCFDIRQQCSGFIYGLQMADSLIRAGHYKNVLLVGAERHSTGLDFSTRGRDVSVLFGDGAGAFILGPADDLSDKDDRDGIIYTDVRADGDGAMLLYMKVFEIDKSPIVQYNFKDEDAAEMMWPQMDGKRVFLHAVRAMAMATKKALKDTGMTWDDIDWFVPHQANLRINQKVVEVAEIPPEKALSTIEFYGNTTAATVPLTIDHWRREGKVKKGDRCLATVFGSGFTWGSAIFTI